MVIESHRTEVKKQLRIAEMLQMHAVRNQQPDAARRYAKRARHLRNSLSSVLGWVTRAARNFPVDSARTGG